MRNLYLNRAIAEAVALEMEQDENVILLGEDILNKGGGMSTYLGIPQKFPDRCLDMPIAESGFTHFANGLALGGKRPIVDLMFSDFAAIPFDPIVNGAAKFRYCSQGLVCVPTVYVAANGGRGTYGGGGSGCNHSQCIESWFTNVPGLKIVAPYYPSDALGLMRSAIRDNDPVLFLYHEGSLGVREQVEDVIEPIPINGAAKIMHPGTDVTIVAIQSMVPLAVEAVKELEQQGISAELIDPRVLIPFDTDAVIQSLNKTGRLVIVQEAHSRGSFAGEILRSIVEKDPRGLSHPVKTLGALNTPIAAGYGEAYMMPHKDDIVKAAKELMEA